MVKMRLQSSWLHGLKSISEQPYDMEEDSCSLHDCMDWNLRVLLCQPHSDRCSLHDCMDWNHSEDEPRRKLRTLQSSWLHGLKFWYITNYTGNLPRCSLHDCMDWNNCRRSDYYTSRVAVFMTAWIEIIYFYKVNGHANCCSLHDCMDWNSSFEKE